MNNSNTILDIKDLEVSYWGKGGKSKILNKISFDIKQGEFLTILGESGSGKSTLTRAITGLLPPSGVVAGRMKINKEPPIVLSEKGTDWQRLRGRQLATIFQDANLSLNPTIKIRKQFEETLFCHRLANKNSAEQLMTSTLNKLNFPSPQSVLNSYPYQLSGGMCQRVCIAIAVCLKPRVLIADEPTSALDTVSQLEVLDLLEKIQKDLQQSVLLITHDIGVAYRISDRIIVLEKGNIVENGTPKEVLLSSGHDYTRMLVDARKFEQKEQTVSRKTGNVILHIKNADKSFKENGTETRALNKLSFDILEGESVGILGFSGCGKSTLAKCIVGLETADGGEIIYNNLDITRLKGRRRKSFCKNIQMVFQDARASLNPRRSAMKLVQEPLNYLRIGSKQERRAKAQKYLKMTGIDELTQQRRPPQLSTGQCQRVAIARALVVEPDILICDESVSALDMIVQKQILQLLSLLQEKLGFSILMISHDIRVIRQFCQMVAVMRDGSFLEFVPSGTLDQNSSCNYTKQLLNSEMNLD